MKIEILFPEICNLFGDMGNMKYLKKCLPNAEFISTAFCRRTAKFNLPCTVKRKKSRAYNKSSAPLP